MAKFGTPKYHNYFSKKFVKFMIQNGFEEYAKHQGNYLKLTCDNYSDKIKALPTVSGPGKADGYTMKIRGGYYRAIHEIENRCKELISHLPNVNDTYFTLSSVAVESKEVLLSQSGADGLFELWTNEMYPKIQKDLAVFEDFNSLNLLFNYPEIAAEKAFNILVNIDKSGIRGEVRSLLIARLAEDSQFDQMKESIIDKYQKALSTDYPHKDAVRDRIEVLKRIDRTKT